MHRRIQSSNAVGGVTVEDMEDSDSFKVPRGTTEDRVQEKRAADISMRLKMQHNDNYFSPLSPSH